MRYWVKLWTETLRDEKMVLLPDHLWRRAIELFMLAGIHDKDGLLPPIKVMMYYCYCHDEVTFRDTLRDLCVTNIVTKIDDETWRVTNFVKRQAPISDKERKKQQRSRENGPKLPNLSRFSHESSHESVTKSVTKRDPEEQKNRINSSTTSTETVDLKLTRYYLNCKDAKPNLAADYISDFLAEYPAADIDYALTEAVGNNAYSLAYIKAICERRKAGGPDEPKSNGRSKNATNRKQLAADERAAQLAAERAELERELAELEHSGDVPNVPLSSG